MTTFDERAREWDTPERISRAARVAVAIKDAVPLRAADRLVDVGAGTGLLGLALVDDVGEVVLLDPSAGMIDVATEKLVASGLPSVRAVRHDLLVDPPPADRFDVAVSLLVLHHLEDTSAALAAIRELLVPGGRIALADLDTEDGSFHSKDAEGIHHRGFDRAALVKLAVSVGFVDVATQTATVIGDAAEGGSFPVFLLTGRRPTAQAPG
ncbi:MAG TPA: class I SAM-dependent methyltransferase [Verrucomicrobiae bacterium]|nr:class I SAM-dependent methyltransferase [Verrucomicrobiae bacterium]